MEFYFPKLQPSSTADQSQSRLKKDEIISCVKFWTVDDANISKANF